MSSPGKNPQTYTIIFTRHGESESNVPDNSGVNKMDPLLTTDKTRNNWPGSRSGLSGRDFCFQVTRREYQDMFLNPALFNVTSDSPVVISSLSRAVQTAIIALPAERLQKSGIIISPLLVEQTTWFSDRTRPISHLRKLVDTELSIKPGLEHLALGLDGFDIRQLSQAVPDESCLTGARFGELAISTDSALKPIEQVEDEEKAHSKPWHLKTSLWHPSQLIRRGEESLKMLMTIGRHNYTGESSTPAIIVFGHGGFINYMTKDIGVTEADLARKPPVLTDWAPGETRVFRLVDEHPDQPVVASPLREMSPTKETLHPQRAIRVEDRLASLDRTVARGGDCMRQRLQEKIVEIDEEYQKLDIYQRAREKNPDDVDGNHAEYAKDIANEFSTQPGAQ
ncbi:hypothetical protein Micbo1qcDRAFT_162303 [Microdochium bolleyi]|uniref:Histidine phosphatase superfamily n=1 Tax=Microdochium bolleyi TaxID=196109 RepID=A0A136J4Q7_9PEZI|nr:hypothetical protein Micbo1qcDRAFT_162303 [Microdochium bolleyi]